MTEMKVYKNNPAWKQCPVCHKYIPFNWKRHVKCGWGITERPTRPVFKTALELKVDALRKAVEDFDYRLNVYRDAVLVLKKKIDRLAEEVKSEENEQEKPRKLGETKETMR